ncbi:dTDP-D-glucose 4,6-dehydratase [Acrasis kona]|uniref:dTDP-D-glucose 4,6-dehydratase n=1 Tax=Acrasis kona TaxID=1008807 RepID=A0AAW2ZKS2_9EUKA
MTDNKVLILGGTGFVARHLIKQLLATNYASKIRAVDKQLPATSYMSDEFKAMYTNEKVEYMQGNLSNEAHVKKAFTGHEWTHVVNLAAETRCGQDEATYKQMILVLSVNCAKEALNHKSIKTYIEFSTAQVYDSGKKPSKESDKLKPWTVLAKYKKEAEDELKKLQGLPLIIVRTAVIYGPGDLNGLMPRIICASTYTVSKEKMKMLWTGDLALNTVHVSDVARATCHLFEKGQKGSVYNLCDKNSTDQEKLNKILEQLFGIDTGFHGSMLSSLAKLNIKLAAETANESHMSPWGEMLKASEIKFTPLSPYIDIELLSNNALSVDGSAIEATGFKYEQPNLTKALLQEEIDYYTTLNLFPKYTPLK